MSIVSDRTPRQWLWWLVALFVLNLALTFENVWPTPAVRWAGGVSVELGVCLLLLAGVSLWRGRVPSRLSSVLAGVGVIFVLGRYAVVTAPALFGRDVNLYWDLRFVPDVIAMLAQPASWLVTFGVIATVVLLPYALYRALRWAFLVVAAPLDRRSARWLTSVIGLTIVALFMVQRSLEPTNEWAGYHDHRLLGGVDFPVPVSASYANQFRVLAKQLSGGAASSIAQGPDLNASLEALKGADVLLFFVESYGAIVYDRPEFRAELEPSRQRLQEEIEASGYGVVSAFVDSPTFGGGSWLAHISLLTGIEVRDEDTNQVLLTQRRDSLVTTFARQGYRTVAMMPGLQRDWPEGSFYRFDRIYGEQHVGYQGPQFGWWIVPDQFSMAKLKALEFDPVDRAPVFAFMAGVTTHTPFSPTAPYQPDWAQLMTSSPYPPAAIDEAYNWQPDWLNLGPSYVRGMKYVYSSIGGYLGQARGRDLVMVVVGDHQPPALVTGLGAPWDVPVHVIASNPSVLRSLEAAGFGPGIEPPRRVLSPLHELTPTLLRALSEPSAAPPD